MGDFVLAEREGLGCPVCRADLLDGRHEVSLLKFGEIPLKIVVCPTVPSGIAWLRGSRRPLLRIEYDPRT